MRGIQSIHKLVLSDFNFLQRKPGFFRPCWNEFSLKNKIQNSKTNGDFLFS